MEEEDSKVACLEDRPKRRGRNVSKGSQDSHCRQRPSTSTNNTRRSDTKIHNKRSETDKAAVARRTSQRRSQDREHRSTRRSKSIEDDPSRSHSHKRGSRTTVHHNRSKSGEPSTSQSRASRLARRENSAKLLSLQSSSSRKDLTSASPNASSIDYVNNPLPLDASNNSHDSSMSSLSDIDDRTLGSNFLVDTETDVAIRKSTPPIERVMVKQVSTRELKPKKKLLNLKSKATKSQSKCGAVQADTNKTSDHGPQHEQSRRVQMALFKQDSIRSINNKSMTLDLDDSFIEDLADTQVTFDGPSRRSGRSAVSIPATRKNDTAGSSHTSSLTRSSISQQLTPGCTALLKTLHEMKELTKQEKRASKQQQEVEAIPTSPSPVLHKKTFSRRNLQRSKSAAVFSSLLLAATGTASTQGTPKRSSSGNNNNINITTTSTPDSAASSTPNAADESNKLLQNKWRTQRMKMLSVNYQTSHRRVQKSNDTTSERLTKDVPLLSLPLSSSSMH